MRILQIGLGSMGKRRIRCLQSLGYNNFVGFDKREDRRKETEQKYHIETVPEINNFDYSEIDCMIISVPPDKHLEYIYIAINNQVSAFVEASVISKHTQNALSKLGNEDIYIAPSCTTIFHPIIKDIKKIVYNKKYGLMTNFSFHTGQYLPDWHPWEDIKKFYVSKRETGGAREIVPFELTWITDTFGFPIETKGFFKRTMDLGVNIEDTYAFIMKFNQGLGSVIVDVTSRFATRSLIVNFERAQLRWNWEDSVLRVFECDKNKWTIYSQHQGKTEPGYNANIFEQMYIDELNAYIKGFEDRKQYPNTLENDLRVLQILDDIESCDGGFNR